jgi:hypothetical protein
MFCLQKVLGPNAAPFAAEIDKKIRDEWNNIASAVLNFCAKFF